MRFKKGSKVEVMNKEIPASWCVAEIISCNGHSYNVMYNGYEGVQKVSRKFIRPCPPAIRSQNWVIGDIVEVFDENSWKVATVSKVLKRGRFFVRPHGLTYGIKTHETNIRARQSWLDGQWIPVGKISGCNEVVAGSKIYQEKYDCLPVYDDVRLPKRKRSSPFCSSLLEAKKFKHAEKEGSHSQRHLSGHTFEKMIFLVMGNLLIRHGLNTKLQQVFTETQLEACISCFQRVQTRKWFCCLSLGKSSGAFRLHLLQIRQFVAIWHLSERYIMSSH